MLVCALGDLLLDVVVRPEAPLVEGGDIRAAISVVPGGQAANVAVWARALGGRGRVLAKHADDVAGRLAREALTGLQVEICGPVVAGRGGVVVSLVADDGERTMASDRGVASSLLATELDASWLACDHLHVSGYVLATDSGRRTAARAVELARAVGARVSVDLAAATMIDELGRATVRAQLTELRPDVVFCNEDENEAVGGPLPGPCWVLKLGGRGVSVDGRESPARRVGDAVDATGAGDAFAAGWILGGVELALDAAALCVTHTGAMPLSRNVG
jgi:sugar/nucleoside kinase (ribokinase family)